MKKKSPVQKILNVGVNALARELGVSSATISFRMKRGQTADQIRREFAQRRGETPGKDKPTGKREYDLLIEGRERMDELSKWKLRRAKALAERQEIENMLRRGELVPVVYVRQWASRFLIEGRDELLKGPSELQDALAAEDDPRKCNTIVRAWLERAIAKFEQTKTIWEGNLGAEEVA